MENYPRGLFFKPIICDLRRFKAINGYIYPLNKIKPLKRVFYVSLCIDNPLLLLLLKKLCLVFGVLGFFQIVFDSLQFQQFGKIFQDE